MKLNSNRDICEAIYEDYIEDSDLGKISDLINKIPQLIENNLGCKISDSEYFGSPYANKYRIASKFIQKYNKSIKSNRRMLKPYEFGSSDTVLAKHDENIIKLTKYVLEDGKYFAKLDKSTYCILTLETRDDICVDSKLYFIGNKWKKWKNKYTEISKKYEELKSKEKSEYIEFAGGRSCRINTVFKSFDQFIFKDKKSIMKYIDNWIENIPIYYNKYNTIPKLSILLHGTPGTGKSTFYKALAKYLDIDNVTILNPEYFRKSGAMNAEDGGSRYRRFDYSDPYAKNYPTLFAIDDIDCICTTRENNNEDKENSMILSSLLSFLDNPPTFDFKAKNGVKYPVSIVVATTNYYDKLDPAVKRFGRFDLTIEMKDFSKKEAQLMCDIYGLKLEDIVKKSNKNDFKISPSKLQAICLKNIDNSLKNKVNIDKEYIDGRLLLHRIKN